MYNAVPTRTAGTPFTGNNMNSVAADKAQAAHSAEKEARSLQVLESRLVPMPQRSGQEPEIRRLSPSARVRRRRTPHADTVTSRQARDTPRLEWRGAETGTGSVSRTPPPTV